MVASHLSSKKHKLNLDFHNAKFGTDGSNVDSAGASDAFGTNWIVSVPLGPSNEQIRKTKEKEKSMKKKAKKIRQRMQTHRITDPVTLLTQSHRIASDAAANPGAPSTPSSEVSCFHSSYRCLFICFIFLLTCSQL
jgi:hypothetical protein